MNSDGQQTLMQTPSMRPYMHRPRGLQMARSLLLLILVVFFPEVMEVGVAVCISLVYEMVCVTSQAATVVTHVATVMARALASYAAVYGRSIESSYIQQVLPPGPASAGDATICRTLTCRVATFGWWLIEHMNVTSFMGLGVFVMAVIFIFVLWKIYQAVQNLLTSTERLVAQVERLQKEAHPDPTPTTSPGGPSTSQPDTSHQAGHPRPHRVSKRSRRQTPSEEASSTLSRTGSDGPGIGAYYQPHARTSDPNPTSAAHAHPAPNSPLVESAAVHLPHQVEETGPATSIGPEDRAAATQDTAAGLPEGSSPAVSAEDQAVPPTLSTDGAAHPSPTPTPPTQATEDDVGPNLHPFEDQAVHPTAAVAAASTPIAQAPVGADAPGEDIAAETPDDSTPAASAEDQAVPPTLPTGEAAIINNSTHTDSLFTFACTPTPTPSTHATEDEAGSEFHPSEDHAAPATIPTDQAAIINSTPIATRSNFSFSPRPAPTPTPSTHVTEDDTGSNLNPSEDQAATVTEALREDPLALSPNPSGPSAAVEFLNGIQVLLTLAENAINPAQGTLPTPITPGSADQGAPRPLTAELAVRTVDSFLLVIDVFQQDGKFTAATTLMDQVVVIAQSVALTPAEQAHLHSRRAMVHRAAGRSVAAFADLLHAAQIYPASSATVEVMDQLVRWGDFLSLAIFFHQVQDLVATSDEVFSGHLQRRMDIWLATDASTKEVLRKEPCPDLPGEALLANLLELMPHHCDNQALMCLQARQQMQLGRFEDTLQTVSGFLGGVGSGVVPSHWALHVTVHVHWLTGGVEQMVRGLKLLMTTNPSPLEKGVDYTIPDNSVLSALLSQLEHLHALWQEFDRLRPEDLDGKEAVLQQVDTMSRGIMSPVLRSRQLLLWAEVHKARASWAVYMGQASQRLVVKALVAAERVRALNPLCWRQAVQVWGPLLEMLGSGRALYDLWSSVLLESDLTPSELVDCTERQSRADPTPCFCPEGWKGLSRPSLNPLQLLGVTFSSSNEEVLRAAKPLLLLCHSDKACLPRNSFVRELEGVGALMGKTALKAMERLQTACTTVSLVNQAAHTLGNRWLKAHAEAWMSFKYTADHLAGILVPPQYSQVVWNESMHGPWQTWVQGVLVTCALMMGTGEHQDLAPHELDVQQGAEAQAEANGSPDVGMCSDDLPEYEPDS